jgi:signal peptidase II
VRFSIDRALVTAFVVLILDQWTKWLAFREIQIGEEIDILPGISLAHTENTGIAFGAFAGRPVIVYSLMAAALGVLVWFYLRHRARPGLWLATGMLLGGAVGNAVDRIHLGYVRDFIQLPHFPTFNIADMAITFGVIILVMTIEMGEDDKTDAAADEPVD